MGEYVHGMTWKRFQSLLDLADKEWHQNLRSASPIINSEQPASDDLNDHSQQIVAHCFQQFKRKDFRLPVSRRRIFILPQKEDALSPTPKPPPQPPPEPIRCYEEIFKVTQEQPEDVSTWVKQRMHFRRELETFGDLQKWLLNKNEITDLEAKALHKFQTGSQVWLKEHQMFMAHKKKKLRPLHQPLPQLLLPTPTMLHNLFSFLYFHKLKILEIFSRSHFSSNHKITREEFMQTLKKVQFPLNQQDMEDMVIYLSSLSKKNIITLNNLETCYKEWVVSRRKNSLLMSREFYGLAKQKALKAKTHQESSPRKYWLITPKVSTSHSMSLKKVKQQQYHKRKQSKKTKQRSPDHLSVQQVPDHCLPSTIEGEMKDFINHFRQKNFLVYLQCCKICELYDIPLTEDLLVKALLYPGDKVISQKDQEHHIRQPGGYYNANKWGQKYARTKERMKDKLSTTRPSPLPRKMTQKTKELPFEEFEVFLSELKTKRSDVTQQTDPNFFWPGHLLDKLQLYLPTMKRDRSLALFSSVCPQPPAYPATYHPDRWWPIKNRKYVTYANYDDNKVYYID